MELEFFKYQGTGNDFVLIDNRQNSVSKNDTKLVKRLCNRKFGIGADGLILLENPERDQTHFEMQYFNADGKESSMCGNGGRCIVAFAQKLGIIGLQATFLAIDGLHEAKTEDGLVSLKMQDVETIKKADGFLFLDTGSPHHVVFTENIEGLELQKIGSEIRHSKTYAAIGGTNVNFSEKLDDTSFKVRTFERGVEAETLSCGTGVTAVALAAYVTGKTKKNNISLQTPGGKLRVSFEEKDGDFSNIWLTGPAKEVFKGKIIC